MKRFVGVLSALVSLTGGGAAAADTAAGWRVDTAGRVQVDVRYDCTKSAPTAALNALGMRTDAAVKLPPLCVVEGWVAPAALTGIAALDGVSSVQPPVYASQRRPRTLTPSIGLAPSPLRSQKAQGASGIDANGISIMHADQFVAQTGTNGAGIIVGVQSTGVTSLPVIQGRGELPDNVTVLAPSGQSTPPVGDEGTALMEEIHAVAPGTGLAFCGPETFVDYISCFGQLIGAGATVLVDDIIFPGEDVMSTNSADAQAIEQLLTQNPTVVMLTTAGNYTNSYWEGAYTPVAAPLSLSCAANGTTQVDNYVASFAGTAYETLTVTSYATFPLVLAWADPSGQNVSNFDLYWYQNGGQIGCASSAGAAQAVLAPQTQAGSSPSITLSAGTYQLYVATPDASLANKFIKLWAGGDGTTTLSSSTQGSIISTQALVPGAITIGAVNGSDGLGNTIEYFSSLGPITVAFPAPAQIQAPVLVAPDGISVDAAGTYFTGFLFPDGNFYGTSASVPNVGAVAALIRSAFPNFSAAQVLSALKSGATPLGSGTPNDTYGYGRVDAMGALNTIPAPTITAVPNSTLNAGASSPAYPITVSGTGPLHFMATSSDTSVIPASIAAAGSAGVSVSPSTCGTTTLTCTVTVTAGQYGGTVNLTLAVADGANRSAPASMTVTVNGPPPPPPPPPVMQPPPTVTVNSSSGGGGGGLLNGWEIVVLAAATLARRRRSEMPAGRG